MHQLSRPQNIASSQQRRDIDVERAVRLGIAQQHAHGAHALQHAVRRRPFVLEQVEADLARLQRNVGVHNGRHEAHLGRLQGILRGDLDVNEPAALYSNQKELAKNRRKKKEITRKKGIERLTIVARSNLPPVDDGLPLE